MHGTTVKIVKISAHVDTFLVMFIYLYISMAAWCQRFRPFYSCTLCVRAKYTYDFSKYILSQH